jgi:magnesium transporter
MAPDQSGVIEVHCFVADHYIVTLHQGDCPALATVRQQLTVHHSTGVAPPQIAIFYLLMDTLVDSFFPVLAAMDDTIDTTVAAILKTPTEEQLGTLFGVKRLLMSMRKVVAPQRDMIASLNAGVVTLPGLTDAGRAYINSLYDHLIRIGDMIDSYRDLTSGATDTHLSMVSNRLNLVMKQLAIIATIFLPLSFLTGFFGQNFSWTISHLQGNGWDLVGWGLGPELLAIGLTIWLFRRRGWLGEGPTA